MKLFLSWSGCPSRQMASILRDWIPTVLPAVDIWMSEEDIDKGSMWVLELATELEQTNACIVCLTPDNLESTWLHFEAGEAAKALQRSLVCPYLLGVSKNSVPGPLSQFQAAQADRDDTIRLVRTLNNSLGAYAVKPDALRRMFDRSWSELETALKAIRLFPQEISETVKQGIIKLIDSSNLPMYFTDANLVVLHCNDHLASLIDSTPRAVIGHPIIDLIERFGRRVPEKRRQPFLDYQRSLAVRVADDLGPHTEATEYVDNRDLLGSHYDGLYRVWIHADKILTESGGDVLGVFVVYRPERLFENSEIPGSST